MMYRGNIRGFCLGLLVQCIFYSSQAAGTSGTTTIHHIVPELCVERALEIGVFTDKSREFSKKALSEKYTGSRSFDVPVVQQAYSKTLKDLNQELENPNSWMFKYLVDCANNEEYCHGAFMPEADLHLRLFCDAEIYQSILGSSFRSNHRAFKKQTDLKRGLKNLSFEDQEKSRQQAQDYRENIEEIVSVSFPAIINATQSAMKASIMPEAFSFILQKISEEFGNWDHYTEIQTSINRHYSLVNMAREFQSCCKDFMLLDEYEIAASYVRDGGLNLEEQLKNVNLPYLTFKPKNEDTKLLLLFRNNKEGYEFVKKQIRTRGQKQSVSPWRLSNEVQKTPQVTNLTSNMIDPRFTFLFSEEAQKHPITLNYRAREAWSKKEKLLSETETIFYKKMFKGFVPYAFGRVAKSKLLREVQKNSSTYITKILKTNANTLRAQRKGKKDNLIPEINANFLNSESYLFGQKKFREWSENVICSPTYFQELNDPYNKAFNNIKKTKLNGSYCAAVEKENRNKTYDRLYGAIVLGEIEIDFPSEEAGRTTYIYDQKFLLELNQKIKAINDYCWNHIDVSGFKKNPDKLMTSKIQNLWSEFFLAAGDDLVGLSFFEGVLQFKSQEANERCFTEGSVFGRKELVNQLGYITAILPSTQLLVANVHPKAKYKAPTFQLQKSDLERIERKIEIKMMDEWQDLDLANRNKAPEGMKNFLEKSATARTLAIIEYTMDHPSKEMGMYLCRLIIHSNDSEVSTKERIEMAKLMIGATAVVLTFGYGAPILAGTASLIEASVAIGSVSAFGGVAAYKIKRLRAKQKLLDQSIVTKSMLGRDVMKIHALYNSEITGEKIEFAIGSAVFLALSARPIFSTGKFVKNLFNAELRFQNSIRLLNLEHYVRTAGIESKYLLSKQFTDFFIKKVANEDAYAFIKLLNRRGVEPEEVTAYIRASWEKELGFVPELNGVVENPSIIRTVSAGISQAAQKFVGPTMLKVRSHWVRFWIKILDQPVIVSRVGSKFWFYDQLALEIKLAKILNRAVEIEKATGKKVFSEEEIAEISKKLKLFKKDLDGTFVRVFDDEFMEARFVFMDKQPLFHSNRNFFENYMKSSLDEQLMSKSEWIELFSNFTRKIETENDLKSLLKVVKFAKREYTGVASKLRNLRELTNLRELSGPVVYREKASAILKEVDRFFDIAKSTKYKNDLRIRRALKDFSTEIGKTPDEIMSAIDKKMENYGLINTEQVEPLVERLKITESKPSTMVTESNLVGKYEQQFWKEESDLNNYFHKVLEKNIRRLKNSEEGVDVFSDSYVRASVKTSERKTLINECTHPSSIVRADVNNLYKKFLIYISMGAAGASYAYQHSDETKNLQWWSRMSFDVVGTYFINKFMFLPLYSSTSRSPIIRDFIYYPAMVAAGTLVEGAAYQATIQSAYNSEDRYREEFSKLVYESENLEESLHQYFQKNPAVEKDMMGRLQKLEEVFQKLKLERSHDMTAQDAEEVFIKAGLVESYFPDQSKLRKYVQEGLIDADLSSNNPDVNNQILDMMTDIVYQETRNHGSANPTEYNHDSGLFFDQETQDRMKFNLGTYELVHTPAALFKNSVVYQSICYGRYLPAPASVIMGLGAYTIYKASLDPWKFKARDEQTGH